MKCSDRRTKRTVTIQRTIVAVACTTASGMAYAGPNILFVRGADRSGGFLEAGNDNQRTEQLADINNTSTSNGNHGWFELAQTLGNAGYTLTQIAETAENASGPSDGLPIPFDVLNLDTYDAVVFGSNNAVYNNAQIDAVENYIRGGGSALFISDANFGGNWADASNSDQQFLDRLGLVMHQDRGTYSIQRSTGDFLVPGHPIFNGVDRFDGEGVTPIGRGNPTAGVSVTLLATAEGTIRLNDGTGGNFQGSTRPATADDAALFVAKTDAGRIAGHFDRNTFFNLNGAGTNINRFDNRQYALNLFAYLTAEPADLDFDGDVDDADLGLAFAGFSGPNVPSANPATDLDNDGDTDDADFGRAFAAFTGPGDAAHVPEPASLLLLGLGGCLIARRRRA